MKSSKKKSKHPSLDIVGTYGSELSGKRIVLCVAGSVAVYKAIELARLLMRHGGNVVCVESYAATKLIKPDYFKWATGNPVITRLTGDLEHIDVADYKRSDLIIVYPGTANTLGKLANGIDDTPVSTVLTVGFGSGIPIVMGLAMHESMYYNKAVRKNIDFLKGKVDFVSPVMIEGKAKAAEPEDVLEFVLKKFGFSSVLHKKRILMTAGPTVEYIDPVRVITNLSTGKTGVLLASELVSAGAKVTLVYGPGTAFTTSSDKLRYCFTNFGLSFSYNPKMSCTTNTCPSQCTPEPIPIVGTLTVSVIIFATSLLTISNTILNAPARSKALASSINLIPASAVLP